MCNFEISNSDLDPSETAILTTQLEDANPAPRIKRPTSGAPAAPLRVSEACNRHSSLPWSVSRQTRENLKGGGGGRELGGEAR